MSDRTPLISVTIPAYNNSRQIADAIESVLRQTLDDLELVIVDDGSIDNTVEVVKGFTDPRIVLIAQKNHGAAHATNAAVRAARGRYVALFAGDDICHPERLERELRYLNETGTRIVFSWATFIDDHRRPLPGPHFAEHWFNHPHRSRPDMLAWFFFHGNYLCTVSCLVERPLLLDAGLFPVTSAQLPDFAMWLALIKHHELAILPEPLIEYRVHADGSNVSGPANSRRAYFELCQLYRDVFDGLSIELFRAAFADRLRRPDFQPGTEHELEKAFLYFQHRMPAVRALGAERLFRLLQDSEHLAVAQARYDFGLPELLDLTKSVDVSGSAEYLELREWASGVEMECKSLRVALANTEAEYRNLTADVEVQTRSLRNALEHAEAEYRKLEAYTRHVLAVKDEIQGELAATVEVQTRSLRTALEQTEAEYRKLEAYTSHLLAVKDEIQAELTRCVESGR